VAYTNPKTWSFGEVLTSTDMNTFVRDNTTFLFDRQTADFSTSTDATLTLDFSVRDQIIRSTRAGELTFAGTNYTAGVSKTIVWNGGTSNRNVNFPAGWVFVSSKPTSLLANKRGVLTVTCHGTAEGDVTAAWAAQA